MKDDPNFRKDFRRDSLNKKKILDKKNKELDEISESKKNNHFKQKKKQIDEEEWEDWDRHYNH